MKRKTVGQLSNELIIKTPETLSPIEQMRENTTEFEDNFWDRVNIGKKKSLGDFYVVVMTIRPRIMDNVIRNYFFDRLTCPTPDYDQVVYKYYRQEDRVEFLWVVPAKDVCEYLKFHALEVHEDEKKLLKFVLDFYDDSLLRLAKKLNGEVMSPGILLEGRR